MGDWMAQRPRQQCSRLSVVVVFVLGISALSCDQSGYVVRVSFADERLRQQASAVDVYFLESCDELAPGETPPAAPVRSFHASEASGFVGRLEPSSYGVAIVVTSSSCRTLASGCAEHALEDHGSGILEVAVEEVHGEGCEPHETCIWGRCVYEGEPSCPDHPEMVRLAPPHENVCIDRWEASGSVHESVQSVGGGQPLVDIHWGRADFFCQVADKRLCKASEWVAACAGPERSCEQTDDCFPYGAAYDPCACNGYDPERCPGRAIEPVLTGSLEPCQGGYPGLYDLSGNLWEWVAPDIEGVEEYRRYGGGFSDGPALLGCTSSLETDPSDRLFSNESTGFRCCLDVDP